jgi:hypothetical protein
VTKRLQSYLISAVKWMVTEDVSAVGDAIEFTYRGSVYVLVVAKKS